MTYADALAGRARRSGRGTRERVPKAKTQGGWRRFAQALMRWTGRCFEVERSPTRIGEGQRTGAVEPFQQREKKQAGGVYLVGAGPGDPELLTIKASRLLQEADVVVYDHLVSDQVMALARRDAERIYVGKERANHTLPQHRINELLVALAREGRKIVRLKGGDPFVFGRGGEELECLAKHGVFAEVVPGITAACGIAAATGVPLTHREHAHSCVFVTGHLQDGTMDLDWEGLARPGQTVVVYMGLRGLPVLCRELVAHGLGADTPAMVVEKGTTPGQRVVVGTLATLAEAAVGANVRPPTLIVVGDVVRLRAVLAPKVAIADSAH